MKVRISPKRPAADTAGLADLFPYYAGFSFTWAQAIMHRYGHESKIVLDPWNGSGTTTLAAAASGNRSIGVDINPVANAVATIKQYSKDESIASVKIGPPRTTDAPEGEASDDPLAAWFKPATAHHLRTWVNHANDYSPSIAAVLRMSVMRVVRQLTQGFVGSNPTWVKRPKEEDRASVRALDIDQLVIGEYAELKDRIAQGPPICNPAQIATASAHQLPLPDASIDLVVTSPPYLTRIDYAVAYSRELAVLGYAEPALRHLRERTMGATLIRSNGVVKDAPKDRAQSVDSLLASVRQHPSKASGGYYLKQMLQYFDDLASGIAEISRVAANDATMHVVVQDSYYKDIPVQLGAIVTDQMQLNGWRVEHRDAHLVVRALTSINTAAHSYPKGPLHEWELRFRRCRRG